MDPVAQDDNWKPLESNPEVMNAFASNIGLSTANFVFHDLLGFEDWAYDMIPKPIIGVVFNFPVKETNTPFIEAEEQKIKANGQVVSPNLFFMKQYAKNACGTIAMVHIVVNVVDEFPEAIKPNSQLAAFVQSVKGKSPEEAGQLFKQAQSLKQAHKVAVVQGQSELCDEVDRHFIAFVLKDGFIYELDGCKPFPINHGASKTESFLQDAALIIKKFFERDPQEVSFSTVVLANNEQE